MIFWNFKFVSYNLRGVKYMYMMVPGFGVSTRPIQTPCYLGPHLGVRTWVLRAGHSLKFGAWDLPQI
jgi:hypothetical protein